MAHDVAGFAMEIYQLSKLAPPEREETVEKMQASGTPTTLPELIDKAASAVIGQRLGWFRKNQFFGGLQGFCILMGMPKADAAYLTGLIQAQVRQGLGGP